MENKKQPLMLGAHMLITGGLEKSLLSGAQIGCTTIQIFTRSPRQWHTKPLEDGAIALFKKTQKETHINPVVAHAPYLINLCASTSELRKKSLKSLIEDLTRCTQLAIPYLVLHPGTSGTMTEKECVSFIATALDEALATAPGNTKILLENTAGQGKSVGHTFEQLALLRQAIHAKKRIGFCFDTCHAFAAGYDMRTPATYKATWQAFDAILGLEHLNVIHINDSKNPLGSHVDRHADIGKGMLGLEAFTLLFNDKRFFAIPKILEIPADTLHDFAKNMAIIKDLLNQETLKKLDVR